MAYDITFLTPLGALLASALLLPLVVLLTVRRRARRVRRALGVTEPGARALLLPLAALLATGALVGLAAAQPILERTSARQVRTDAEVFLVLDVSRSMLARERPGSPRRFDRAREVATELRERLGDVPIGLASFTDRALPHLFPTSSLDVFQATLERSIGIERPPPSSGLLTQATKLDALATIRGLRYFSPTTKKRLVVTLTDGESLPVAGARLGSLYRRPPVIETIFVQFWNKNERVYTRGAPEPQYVVDPAARSILDGVAASTRGKVYSENEVEAVARQARRMLGRGPTEVEGKSTGREALAPYLAMAAFLPLSLLLWRRDR
jgi:hypothetical protein